MKRKLSPRTVLRRQIEALESKRAKVRQELHDLEGRKVQAIYELQQLLNCKEFKQSQIVFSKRLLFDIENDTRVQLSEHGTVAKKFIRSLDEQLLRLIHGGRQPERIMVANSGVMTKLNQKQLEAGGRLNYAGVPVWLCDSLRPSCFIIQSSVGKTSVASERGWVEVATAGYNAVP